MSEHLSFREKIVRLAATKASGPDLSISPVEVRIDLVEPLVQPVELARLLSRNGLGLKKAHELLGTLVTEHVVSTTLRPKDPGALFNQLRGLGLVVSIVEPAHLSAAGF